MLLRHRIGGCSNLSVELRHDGRLRCRMVTGYFEVDGWESCCLVRVGTGE